MIAVIFSFLTGWWDGEEMTHRRERERERERESYSCHLLHSMEEAWRYLKSLVPFSSFSLTFDSSPCCWLLTRNPICPQPRPTRPNHQRPHCPYSTRLLPTSEVATNFTVEWRGPSQWSPLSGQVRVALPWGRQPLPTIDEGRWWLGEEK